MLRQSKQTGFTVVEIIAVVVVIAILAAISTAAYGSIVDRASDSAVQMELATAHKQLQIQSLEGLDFSGSLPDLKFSEDPYDKAVINLIYIQGKTGS